MFIEVLSKFAEEVPQQVTDPNYGLMWAAIGAALAIILASIGSSIGVGRAGMMAGGILSKDPSKFGQVLILQLLPATQGMYGFIVSFIAMLNLGFIGGSPVTITVAQGLTVLGLCLPVGIIGLVSAVFQGKVAMTGMELCVKQDKQMGRAMTMAALVEIFAIFSFVVSLLGVLGYTGSLA